jgi:hypothetical protein
MFGAPLPFSAQCTTCLPLIEDSFPNDFPNDLESQ